MKKRLLSILLVLLMALTLLPLGALADENSKCGESLTWNLDEIGILTISGTGDMYNYSSAYPAPWSAKNNDISEIIVLDGVTSIGNKCCVLYFFLLEITPFILAVHYLWSLLWVA